MLLHVAFLINVHKKYAEEGVELTLIGNKTDRKKDRKVPSSKGQEVRLTNSSDVLL